MNYDKWREFLLNEITTLPQEVYKAIEEELEKSNFWLEPHTDDDIKGKKTPLTMSIQSALDKAFSRSGLDVVSKVFTIRGTEKPEDKSSYTAGASFGVSKGKGVVEMMIYPFPDEDFELDVEELIDEISEVVRHELIHSGQLQKQAARKKTTLTKASKDVGFDKYQVPQTPESDPQYEEVYYSRKIEIEAFAHQIAEYLLKFYDKDEALNIISQPSADMPEDVRDMQMWKSLEKRPKALKRFKNRVYAYIQHLTEN